MAPVPGLDTVTESARRPLAERLAGWQREFPDVAVDRVVAKDRPARSLLRAAEVRARLLSSATTRH